MQNVFVKEKLWRMSYYNPKIEERRWKNKV